MVDFDKLEVDIFNTRPIFYSKEHDFYSHSLTDFKKFNIPLDPQTFSKHQRYNNFFYGKRFGWSNDYPFHFTQVRYLVGVDYIKPKESLKITKDITDFEKFKDITISTIENQLNKYKNNNNILLLSTGLDSQLLLMLLLNMNISFLAVHMYNQKEEANWLIEQSKKLNYKLKIIKPTPNIGAVCFHEALHPPTWGLNSIDYLCFNPCFTKYGFHSDYIFPKYINKDIIGTEYENVITGIRLLVQDWKWDLYYRFSVKRLQDCNKFFNKYRDIFFSDEEDKILKKNFPTCFDHIKAVGIFQNRHYVWLEKETKFNWVSPFINKKLIEATLALGDSALFKNCYKYTTIEILEKEKFNINLKSYRNPIVKNIITQDILSTWYKNYNSKENNL